MARVLVAVNAASGRGRGRTAGEDALAALQAAGHDARRIEPSDGPQLERLLRDAAAGGATDAVVVIGGDGTLHSAVNALAQTGVPIGIVPTGTGNDVARCLGLPHDDPAAAIAVVVAALGDGAPPARPIDAVRVSTGRWFVGMLSAGFDAFVNERANRMTHLSGTPRYIAAVLLEVVRLHARRYRVTIDRDTRHLDAVLVTVGNTASIGGGMRLAPDAEVDDGLLDVLVATPLSRLQLIRLLPRTFTGTHVTDEHVTIVRGRVITIDVDDRGAPPVSYADGERFGPLPVTLEVVRGALHVLG